MPSSIPRCSSYWKGAFGSFTTKVANFSYWDLVLDLTCKFHRNSLPFWVQCSDMPSCLLIHILNHLFNTSLLKSCEYILMWWKSLVILWGTAVALWIGCNEAQKLKLFLTSESSTDEGFVGYTAIVFLAAAFVYNNSNNHWVAQNSLGF